jgi:MoaA/NifB/PqqE/SkfB family radical SAM enzyme
LRDADQLNGKCGVCEFKQICGGSRSRSFALTGDPLAAEPDCAYVPPHYDREPQPCSA